MQAFTRFRSKSNSTRSALSTDRDILEIGAILRTVKSSVKAPRLVVCGSQSSGKTTLLNTILGMDLLPTGDDMVTRIPLHLELRTEAGQPLVQFGDYSSGGKWGVKLQFNVCVPDVSDEDKATILSYINKETESRAGTGKNVSRQFVTMRIQGPMVPNLNMVDLPGLTNIPLIDRGQPKDIKKQIIDLVASYISCPDTIIIAVLHARVDIEADAGLDLVKQHDPRGERSLGILTKTDLMNPHTNILHLLKGDTSQELRLRHGYFAVKNRHDPRQTIQAGLSEEAMFFEDNPAYTGCDEEVKKRLGVPSLTVFLSRLLIDSLRNEFPVIRETIQKEYGETKRRLSSMESCPSGTEDRIRYVQSIISRISNTFTSHLDDRGTAVDTGRRLRQMLSNLRKEILCTRADSLLDQEHLKKLIVSQEGNHMPFPCIPVELLETVMRDPIRRPIHKLVVPSTQLCCREIAEMLMQTATHLLSVHGMNRFPVLCKKLLNILHEDLIMQGIQMCDSMVATFVEDQEAYIWTHDDSFYKELRQVSGGELDAKSLLHLAGLYIGSVKNVFADIVPKMVMRALVRRTQGLLLDQWLVILRDIQPSYLEEDLSLVKVRDELNARISVLNRASFLLDQVYPHE